MMTKELILKAEELGNPHCIAKWVHEKIEHTYYVGSIYPPLNVMEARRGNSVDIAKLIVTMLEAIGVEACVHTPVFCGKIPSANVIMVLEKERYIIDTVCKKNYKKDLINKIQ
jgi:transglutaminase-like putative cysteine protease